jgi:hypothetical protein
MLPAGSSPDAIRTSRPVPVPLSPVGYRAYRESNIIDEQAKRSGTTCATQG